MNGGKKKAGGKGNRERLRRGDLKPNERSIKQPWKYKRIRIALETDSCRLQKC
jgi:hypothetical protein